jgi:hypothetical protein
MFCVTIIGLGLLKVFWVVVPCFRLAYGDTFCITLTCFGLQYMLWVTLHILGWDNMFWVPVLYVKIPCFVLR